MFPVKVRKNYPIKIELSDIESLNIDDDYLVEIPYDYQYLIISDMECALNTSLNNIYIEIKYDNKWQTQINKYNSINWKYNLKIGDIIEVFDIFEGEWFQCMVRYTDKINNEIYIHYIGWPIVFNEVIKFNDTTYLDEIDKRYSNTIKQYFPQDYFMICELDDNKKSFNLTRISYELKKANEEILKKFGIN